MSNLGGFCGVEGGDVKSNQRELLTSFLPSQLDNS
jgi:hypothetical protein